MQWKQPHCNVKASKRIQMKPSWGNVIANQMGTCKKARRSSSTTKRALSDDDDRCTDRDSEILFWRHRFVFEDKKFSCLFDDFEMKESEYLAERAEPEWESERLAVAAFIVSQRRRPLLLLSSCDMKSVENKLWR